MRTRPGLNSALAVAVLAGLLGGCAGSKAYFKRVGPVVSQLTAVSQELSETGSSLVDLERAMWADTDRAKEESIARDVKAVGSRLRAIGSKLRAITAELNEISARGAPKINYGGEQTVSYHDLLLRTVALLWSSTEVPLKFIDFKDGVFVQARGKQAVQVQDASEIKALLRKKGSVPAPVVNGSRYLAHAPDAPRSRETSYLEMTGSLVRAYHLRYDGFPRLVTYQVRRELNGGEVRFVYAVEATNANLYIKKLAEAVRRRSEDVMNNLSVLWAEHSDKK